jgi:ParB family chromosome partitioning protein
MDIENRQRADISPYERGLSYTRWLRSGYFQSQHEIGRALNVSTSQISRLLKIARLPTIVVDAFGSAVSIREGWGLQLAAILEDPAKRHAVLDTARALASHEVRPLPEEVYRRMLAAVQSGRKARRAAHDVVVKADDGSPLFRVRSQRSSIAFVVPLQLMSAERLKTIQVLLENALREPAGTARSDAASLQSAIA